MEYIQNSKSESGCVFCGCCEQADSPGNLIVARGPRTFVILNRFPYTSGHLMIVPVDHQPSLEKLDAASRLDIMDLSARAIEVLNVLYTPQGYNLGMNIGNAAGAGITEHVHLHVVPRWVGDTNFMSTLAETRVLPETLADTWNRIRVGFTSATG